MELNRRFWVLTDKDEHEPDRTAALIDYGLAEGETWSEVLRHPRTVILAEAGAGKTYELQQRARNLTAEGSFAVFVPLEALASSSLPDLLDVEEEQRLAAWLKDGHSAGFFFLDAVDELKLTDRKLDRALLQLAKAIHGHQHRARIFLSSRPSDWRKVSDREVLEQRLGYSAPESLRPESSAEEIFLRALRREEGAGEEKDENDHLPAEPVRILVMLAMSVHQIRQFAAHSGVHDLEAFLSELERRNAWTFARRPLDLEDLVQLWLEEGRLGTRAEQHEANVRTKLRDNPERADANVLSTSKAREGAERLALALFLTKSRTLRAPGQDLPLGRAAGVLVPADVLRDWTAGERSALLRRALFDPATHGRVRFHHRSVQEYLAARRLSHLRNAGMSIKALRRLLFATRYGIDVVIPSMRAVVAWLALWIDDVRRETMRREPEILVSFGDPETLPIETRSKLLARLAETYGSGGWRGLELPLDEVRRLAHPELGPKINELWGSGPENQEIRGLLLRLIWQGRIESCADIAETLASDGKQSDMDRILAIRALVATGRKDCLHALADDMIKHPNAWSDRVVVSSATELFPDFLSLDALLQLVERTPEPENSVEGFAWVAREIADQLDPKSELAIGLRDRLAELVLSKRDADIEPYDIRGSFDYLTPATAKLCLAQLSRLDGEPPVTLIRAAAIASRFGQRELGRHEPVSDLRAFFQSDGQRHRAKAFWTELDLMDLLSPTTDSWESLYNAENNGLIGPLVDADTVWLERALMDAGHPERRAPALHALVNLWQQRDQSPEDLEALASTVREDPVLSEILDARTRPNPLSSDQERRMQEAIRSKDEVAAQRQDRLRGWQDWREELLAEPDAAFSSDRLRSDVSNVYVWLKAGAQRSRRNVWDGEKLAAAFGPELKERIQESFQEHWRSVTPVPWSGRSREERNVTLGSWIIGLCGISAESETPGWAAQLTRDEARLAALYSLIELNGFASFLTDLAEAHPDAVEDVIGEELSVELQRVTEEAHLPTLQNLGHADLTVKRLMAPRLLSELGKWPAAVVVDEEFQLAQHLGRVLHLLAEITEGAERERLALVCRQRLLGSPRGGALQLAWLKGLIGVDAVAAANELVAILGRADDPETRSRGAAILGHLFGELHGIAIEIADPGLRAQVLGKLIRAAYSFVRREEDVVREGNYTPDSRDDAQSARGSLLAQLVETPGDEARRVLLELAEEPDFQHFRDRLRFLARQRAATDAEGPPYAAEAVYDLERRFEAPPSDRDGLFVVVLDRFDDIAHDIRDGDFTDRKTLRTISDETEMQRTLAGRLEAKANGAYMVVREEEVADHKLPDIRLAATRGDQRVAVEVKIADNDWSIADFEHSLEHQVVGQYLRHDRCKAGCFLLTFAGTKWWNNPAGGRRLTFIQLIEHLNKKARVLEDAENGRIRLSVVGLDLTDPELAPAHR